MTARRLRIDEDERLDRIARAVYGTEQGGTVEALLDRNPGLAAIVAASGGFVPAGREIVVPEIVETASAIARPWA